MFFYYFATIMLLQKVRFPFLLGEGLVLAHSWWCSKNHILQGLKPGPSTCKAHVLDHQVLPLTIRSCGSTYIIAQLNPFTQQGTHTLHKRSLQQHPPRTWPPHNTFLFCFGATPGSAQSLSWNVLGDHFWQVWGTCGVLGTETGSVICKANILHAILWLWSTSTLNKQQKVKC